MDRHLWYYRFKADVEWLENFIEDIERTDRNLITSMAENMGVSAGGFDVTERGAGQNFSVDITAGQGYDWGGKHFYSAETQNLPFVEDEDGNPIEVVGSGNERIVSIYASYALVDEPSSDVVDGFGDTIFTIQTEEVVFELYQGTEAGSGLATPLADPGGDHVLLANVTIKYGDSTIANADIDNDVKEYLTFVLGPDTVGEDEIDWGLGSNQVSAEDVPIRDTDDFFISENVEDALAELITYFITTTDDLAAHEADVTTHGVTAGAIVGTTMTQTLTNKTLTTPTIASFTNANHNHQNSAGGGQLDIVNATTGTLSVARGGTGTTTSTGTGSVVLSSSPTIVTPTIASFTNANHNHENSAGGGTLSAAAIASGTLPVARGGTGTTTSTGTGSVVLSASPTFTGTVTMDDATFTGDVVLPDIDPPASNAATQQSLVKGWVNVSTTGTSSTDYNVASTTRTSDPGQYRITWDFAAASGRVFLVTASGTTTTYNTAVSGGSSTTFNGYFVYDETGALTNDGVSAIITGDSA